MTVIVPLTKGYVAIIDDEDAGRVLMNSWCATRSFSNRHGEYVYACSAIANKKTYLHRFILGAQQGDIVDHINHDRLDNRRSNLRLATQSQNSAHTQRCHSSTGYRGVKTRDGRFVAIAFADGRQYIGGTFATAIEAAVARDALAVRLFGDYASLNFPLHQKVSQPSEERLAKDVAQISGSGAATPEPTLPALREDFSMPFFIGKE